MNGSREPLGFPLPGQQLASQPGTPAEAAPSPCQWCGLLDGPSTLPSRPVIHTRAAPRRAPSWRRSAMTPVSKSLVAGVLTLAALAAAAGGAQAMQKGGGISTRSATPGAVTFDPPLVFAATLPLKGFYLNAKTGMSFVGTGALLDATSPNFSGVTGVTGGFLAFDCHSRNADGSVPELPLRIKF